MKHKYIYVLMTYHDRCLEVLPINILLLKRKKVNKVTLSFLMENFHEKHVV